MAKKGKQKTSDPPKLKLFDIDEELNEFEQQLERHDFTRPDEKHEGTFH